MSSQLLDVEAGNHVPFAKWSGTEIHLDGKKLMQETDVEGGAVIPWTS